MDCPRCKAHMRPGCEGKGGRVIAWTERCFQCGTEVRAEPRPLFKKSKPRRLWNPNREQMSL